MRLLQRRFETGKCTELLQLLQEDIVRQVDAQRRNADVPIGYSGHIGSFLWYGRDVSPYPVDGGSKLIHAGCDTMRIATAPLRDHPDSLDVGSRTVWCIDIEEQTSIERVAEAFRERLVDPNESRNEGEHLLEEPGDGTEIESRASCAWKCRGEGHTGVPGQKGLVGARYCTGVGQVVAQIVTMVDTGEDNVDLLFHQHVEAQHHAIDGSSRDRPCVDAGVDIVFYAGNA